MGDCKYCGKQSIMTIGSLKTPLCDNHYDMFLRGFAQMLKTLRSALV